MFTKRKDPVVYIADQSDNEVSKDLGYIECSLERPARMIGTPVETGVRYFDHKVVDPRTITVTCLVSTDAVSQAKETIEKMQEDKSTDFYVVFTKSGIYRNMSLVNVSEPEKVDYLDTVQFTLKFQEVLIQSQAKQTKDSSSQNTRKGTAKAR